MKSLYGHMRSHPRDWKGIHPPAPAENPVVDLKKALKCRWSVTAKRGRKVMSGGGGGDQTSSLSEDTEEEQLRDAAHELMMLAHGGESRRHDQELDSKSLSYEVMTKNVRGKAKAPENQESKKKSMISGYRETRADEKTRKKRMKLIKLKDLESVHHNATATIDHDNRTPAAVEKYKCSECDKWFRTHQALGGHKSSHNKLCKMVIQNSIDDDPLMPSNQVTNSSGELSHTAAAAACDGGISHHNHQILDFDLNEVPETTE
nr:zinc finger protein ZAT2 [Ipomoea batatas]GME21565.1 zinc finger protein ZAT2 [Ipomoea batatas]